MQHHKTLRMTPESFQTPENKRPLDSTIAELDTAPAHHSAVAGARGEHQRRRVREVQGVQPRPEVQQQVDGLALHASEDRRAIAKRD